MPQRRMSDEQARAMENNWTNIKEAFRLLDLINMEFQSDPMSVQCFDLRIVERVKACLALRQVYESKSFFAPQNDQ